MLLLYRTVLIQERNNDRFNISGDQNRSFSKRGAMQGIYFSSAYFLMWMFWYVYTIMNNLFDSQLDWIWILNAIFILFQGLYNLIVYLRRRYLMLRQEHYAHQGSSTLITHFFLECLSKMSVGGRNLPIKRAGKTASSRINSAISYLLKKTELAAPLWFMIDLCRRQETAMPSTQLYINHGIDQSRRMKWEPNIQRKGSLHLDYIIFIP